LSSIAINLSHALMLVSADPTITLLADSGTISWNPTAMIPGRTAAASVAAPINGFKLTPSGGFFPFTLKLET